MTGIVQMEREDVPEFVARGRVEAEKVALLQELRREWQETATEATRKAEEPRALAQGPSPVRGALEDFNGVESIVFRPRPIDRILVFMWCWLALLVVVSWALWIIVKSVGGV